MKYILLISALVLTQVTYAQLPAVIGKEKEIMKVYCDSLIAKLHFQKKSMGRQNDAILWDKGKHNIILLNFEVDSNKLVSKVAILGPAQLIEEMQHTIYQGKRVFLADVNIPSQYMVMSGKMASLTFNTND